MSSQAERIVCFTSPWFSPGGDLVGSLPGKYRECTIFQPCLGTITPQDTKTSNTRARGRPTTLVDVTQLPSSRSILWSIVIHCIPMEVDMPTKQISVRADQELIAQFNALAEATERSRTFLINQAMEEYIAREAWQVAEIKEALKEADDGDFASDEDMAAMDSKWKYNAD